MHTSDPGRNDGPEAIIDEGVLSHTRYGVEVCEIVEWVEDGMRVVSAVDFDLVAVGANEAEALQKFANEVKSLVEALEGPIDRGEATRDEINLYLRLVQPLIAVMAKELAEMRGEQSRLEDRLIDFPRLRRGRGEHSDGWRNASSRGNLKHASLV